MFGLLDEDDIPDINKLTLGITQREGERLKPYTDTTGNITIGVGRNLSAKGISSTEAVYLLNNDIQDAILQAKRESWLPHVANNDARCRAMVEIVFNIGLGSLNGFVKAIACLCADDFVGAAAEFMDSQWANQVGNRAVILTDMIRTGSD